MIPRSPTVPAAAVVAGTVGFVWAAAKTQQRASTQDLNLAEFFAMATFPNQSHDQIIL